MGTALLAVPVKGEHALIRQTRLQIMVANRDGTCAPQHKSNGSEEREGKLEEGSSTMGKVDLAVGK